MLPYKISCQVLDAKKSLVVRFTEDKLTIDLIGATLSFKDRRKVLNISKVDVMRIGIKIWICFVFRYSSQL